MLIIHIQIHVHPADIEAFSRATVENARESIGEPGIARFDVLQQVDDPTRFLLVEVYRDEDAAARHKETAHYARWRDLAGGMMATPRLSIKYASVFPMEEVH